MTHSPTPAELLAIRTGNAALLNSPDSACDIVSTIVFALGAAGLLMDPETAEELRRLRVAAGDGHTRTCDEDPIAFALTEHAEALHASSGAVIETNSPIVDPNGCRICGIAPPHGRQWTADAGWHQWAQPTQEQIKERMLRRRSVMQLRALLAGQREDPHDSELHRPYALGRDLPEPGVRS
ncbi:hypothetical protein [Streptomyces sp.]|uniref:hypothetical protein n=1 Tax=Streptomyces sp. TaxID=1931 RepID=UPI002D78E00D|nr:hypothetical protein [Streptomyces sp.]HET6356050.1 hypothetical protein [Streptomyces sp.]